MNLPDENYHPEYRKGYQKAASEMINELFKTDGFEIRSNLNFGRGEERIFYSHTYGGWFFLKNKDSGAVRVKSAAHFLELTKQGLANNRTEHEQ